MISNKEKFIMLKEAEATIGTIMAQYGRNMIKDYEIPILGSLLTNEDLGFVVRLHLKNRVPYFEKTLTEWKNLFKADTCYIYAKGGKLYAKFKVLFKEEV